MDNKEMLQNLRKEIDAADKEFVELFKRRMRISDEIADVKMKANISVTDTAREGQVVASAAALADENASAEEITALMRALIGLSKIRQNSHLFGDTAGNVEIPVSAPRKIKTVAFQGVTGAWGEQAAISMYPKANYIVCDEFEDVFAAVKAGQADVGVLPIENSQNGAVGVVYDLLRKNSCFMVNQSWQTIAQCLLAKPGTELADIREIFSHPEGLKQCRRFLLNRNWELTACRNTAYAAKMVSERADSKGAAIGSRRAAEAHGLDVLVPDIMDSAANRTRFIAIAAQPIYDESGDTTSITFSTAHTAGALCAVLQTFMTAGINLTRIESRPASADHYRFFADLQANVLSEVTRDALKQAAMHCDYFEFLGCYKTK